MRVLLVFSDLRWVLGQFAEALCQHNPDIEFLYANRQMPVQEPEQFQELVHQSDVIHWIANVGHADHELATWSLHERPSVASVYHIAPGDDHKVQQARGANRIHVMSAEWKTDLETRFGIPGTQIVHIPLGVDTRFFKFHQAHQKGRHFRVGYFAAPDNTWRKGVDVFLTALQLFAKLCPELEVVLTGPGWEKYLAKTENLTSTHKGLVSKHTLRHLYQTLDAYVISARCEGGPVTLLEALSSGVPVISTPVGYSMDMLQNEVNGLLVEKDQPAQIVEQLVRLRQSWELRQRIAMTGRQTAENYAWPLIAPRYSDLYHDLLNQSKQHAVPHKSGVRFRNRTMSPAAQRRIIRIEEDLRWSRLLIHASGAFQGYVHLLKNIPVQYIGSFPGPFRGRL